MLVDLTWNREQIIWIGKLRQLRRFFLLELFQECRIKGENVRLFQDAYQRMKEQMSSE